MFAFNSKVNFPKIVSFGVLCLFLFSNKFLFGDSIRIKNRIVDTGMSKGKVFMIMGQPDWKANYIIGHGDQVESFGRPLGVFSNNSRVAAYSGDFSTFGSVAVEEWVFNRGKYRLMQLLRFEDERLIAIQSLGYGFNDEPRRTVIVPDWSSLKIGDTSYELLIKFGEPSLTESKPNISFVRIYGPHRHPLHYRSADVSWWYYNGGPNRLFRIIKLVNGRVVEIETEGYGLRVE